MKPVTIGQRHTHRVKTTHAHTADALGNRGVNVVATPVLIGFLEVAATECLKPACDDGEGSVGTFVNVRHLAPAPAEAVIEATAVVTAVNGRQVEFAVSAKWGEVLLMEGSHGRAVVNLARFFAKLGTRAPEG
jgi:fluoroacetyl-CoA thioesterase